MEHSLDSFTDTERGGMDQAVREARAELDMDEPTEISTAPLEEELTRVDGGASKPKSQVRGQVLIARVIKVGG